MTALTGTRLLLRAALKHDLRPFAPWIAIVTVLSASSVLVYPWVFPDQESRTALAAAIGGNPALGIIFGPAFDLSTGDGFNAWRALSLGGFLTALGAIFAVTRTTRKQEDSGQAELLASGVLGRSSRLFAGVGVAVVGSLITGLVAAIVTVAFGGGWDASMILGATFTVTGWMFAGIAAITVQLGADARMANSLAVGILGALFLLRGFAYSLDSPEWTIWVNPLGWMTQTEPGTSNDWLPLLYGVALTVVTLALAFIFQTQRDFGQGLVAPRPGPAHGRIRSVWGLAIRLNAGPSAIWASTFVVLGLVFGYYTTSIRDLLSENDMVSFFIASGAVTQEALVSAFLVTVFSIVGMIAAVPGIQIMIKVRTEELEDRVEPVLATPVSRSRYYGCNVMLALVFPGLYMLLAGIVIAAIAASSDVGVVFGDALLQSAATVPALWTVISVSVAVVGARPRVLLAAWVGLLASFALTILGPIFDLWDWILGISPFWHVPDVATAPVDWSGLWWVSLFSAGFLIVGFIGFRRRDIASR